VSPSSKPRNQIIIFRCGQGRLTLFSRRIRAMSIAARIGIGAAFKRIADRAAAFAMLTALSAFPVQAGYVVVLQQEAGGVVATGSGSIDLTGLTFLGATSGTGAVAVPNKAIIATGAPSDIDGYTGFTGPTSFGPGFGRFSNVPLATGDDVEIFGNPDQLGQPELFVPHNYVNDTPLSDTAPYNGESFSSIGATPGTYEWKWGTGPDQNFTLDVVPEPSTWIMMLAGFAGLGVVSYRQTRRAKPQAA
jgi:hypothetical protein